MSGSERERLLLVGVLARLPITERELRDAVEETVAEERAGLMRAVGLCRPAGERLSG